MICDISAHRLIFAALSPPLPNRIYWNRAAMQKEWWETIAFWQIYSSFTHLFFNQIAIFGTNPRSVISQFTVWFLSRRCSCPIEFIRTEQQRKNNGEKPLRFDNFTVLLLTFFSIKLPFLGRTRDLWYLSPQTDFCLAAAAWLCLSKQSGDKKRMVRNHWVLTILQFFYSPFFN